MTTSAPTVSQGRGSGFTEVVSRDADEVVHILSRRLAPHRLVPRDPANIRARVATLALGPALLVDLGYGADVEVYPGEFTDLYLVHAATVGTAEMTAGSSRILIHPGNVPISSVGTQPRFRMGSQCRHQTLRIGRTALETHFSRALGRQVTDPVTFSPQVAQDPTFSKAWRALLAHLNEQAALVPQLMAGSRMQSHYFRVALEMLLQGAPHSYSYLLEREPQAAASVRHVRRACDVIESHMGEPLSVTCVARLVGVSVRSLQSGFRRAFGITPLQFIRDRRLERLHAGLQAASPTVSVTDLMLECGIVNFGRFAQYYRRRFGCRPSQTLQKRWT
jgi:AraC-like DNA-binding protein